MAVTFDVLLLGKLASSEPTEGTVNAENASVLVGETIGGPGTSLYDKIMALTCLAQGREHDADQGALLACRSNGAQQYACSGDALSRIPTVNNQSILRFDRSPAVRSAAAMKESA